jgi:DNA adenine methylase
MLRSPIRWLGGKGHLVKKLLPYLETSHTTYCSVFGGGASDLLAKKRVQTEVYNDIDENLIQLFRALQGNGFLLLYTQLCLTPYSRGERNWCRLTEDTPTEMEAVRRWYVQSRQSFGGLVDKTAWGLVTNTSTNGMAQSTASYAVAVERLLLIHERLRNVVIHNEDWSEILSRYDGKDTLFYLDPPYLPEERRDGWYAHEMSLADHQRLVKQLLHTKGKILLSGYPNVVYEELEDAGWTRTDFAVACMVVARTTATGLKGTDAVSTTQKRTEAIWYNYKA